MFKNIYRAVMNKKNYTLSHFKQWQVNFNQK